MAFCERHRWVLYQLVNNVGEYSADLTQKIMYVSWQDNVSNLFWYAAAKQKLENHFMKWSTATAIKLHVRGCHYEKRFRKLTLFYFVLLYHPTI